MASPNPTRPRPPRRFPKHKIIIELPSRPADYVPGSGPPLRPPFLQPPADSTAYIDDRILLPPAGVAAADGRPLPKRMKYIVGWWDLPAARLLVPAMDVLDYVSPHALEEWEYKMELELDVERARLAAERLALRAQGGGSAAKEVPEKEKKKKRKTRPPMDHTEIEAAVVAETQGGSGGEQGRLHGGAMSLSTPKKRKRKEFLDSCSSEESPSEQLLFDVSQAKRAKEMDTTLPHALRPAPMAPMAPVAPMVVDDGGRYQGGKSQVLKKPGFASKMALPLMSASAATKPKPERTGSPAMPFSFAKAREREPARPSIRDPAKLSTRDPAKQTMRDPARLSTRDPAEQSMRDPAKQSMRDPAKQSMRDPAKQSTRDPAKQSTRDSAKQTMRDPARLSTRDPSEQSMRDPAKQSMRDLAKPSTRDPAKQSTRDPAKPSSHAKQHSSRTITEYLSGAPKNRDPSQLSAQRPSKRPSEPHAEQSHPRPHAKPKYRPHVAQKKTPSGPHARRRSPERSKGKRPALPIFADSSSDDDELDWAVECLEDLELYDVEGRGLVRYFKVRWEGDWPPDQKSTWEPEENIPDYLVRDFCRTYAEKKRTASSSTEPRHASKGEETARLPPLRPMNKERNQAGGQKEEVECPSSANSGMFVYSSDDAMEKHVWDAPNSQGARPNLNLVFPAPMT